MFYMALRKTRCFCHTHEDESLLSDNRLPFKTFSLCTQGLANHAAQDTIDEAIFFTHLEISHWRPPPSTLVACFPYTLVGMSRIRSRLSVSFRSFPTHSGMSRRSVLPTFSLISFPHAHGDGSVTSAFARFNLSLSLHVRG